MNVFLLYKDRDFDSSMSLPWNYEALKMDLGLDIILNTMADEDSFLYETVQKVLLSSLTEKLDIEYRQDVLKDCLENSEIIENIYELTIEAIKDKKDDFSFGLFSRNPVSLLSGSSNIIKMFITNFKKLRKIAEKVSSRFHSDGFKRFFKMLEEELNDEYLEEVLVQLKKLDFKAGTFISASLGEGNISTDFVLENPPESNNFFSRLLVKRTPKNTFTFDPRDEIGFKILREIKSQAMNESANAIGQAADNIMNFFIILRQELAFYIGAMNLSSQITKKGKPFCFPEVLSNKKKNESFSQLYNLSLVLLSDFNVQGIDAEFLDKEAVIITGANQGGKTTFLRSFGIAKIMMQSGLFVPAEYFKANINCGIFTHFQKEEDNSMQSGKFDEELSRMSEIVKFLKASSLLLCNESFSSTNEREGSVIGRQIIDALRLKGVQIFFVTHFFELADYFYNNHLEKVAFLRAPRDNEGNRSYKLIEDSPLKTSFGEDLYEKIFL